MALLVGRRSECEVLDRVLGEARSGRSAVVVVRGEPGVGKTALLDYSVRSAADLKVVTAVGVESEMELPFAALHQLCGPVLGRLERLPRPQRDALGIAFGLEAGPAPDLFLVALAALSLLAEESQRQPLLCAVDDAQWLDRASAQVVGFVGRRLLRESIAVVLAARTPTSQPDHLGQLPELRLHGLDEKSASAVLAAACPGPLDESVRARIIDETHGNPLALLELGRASVASELAGGFSAAEALPRRIEDEYLGRLNQLPVPARRLMLLAAGEPVGDAALLLRAAQLLDVDLAAVKLATDTRLLNIGEHVRFRHPLVRSAVYGSASTEERRAAHGALAAATDPTIDPDRRAWHRAQAATGPDESVASDLISSASRAQSRGGVAAAAAFWERAVAMTPDSSQQASRALVAAEAKYAAGDFEAAQALLAVAETRSLSELDHAHVQRMRAQIAFALRRGRDAPPLLLRAAQRLQTLDAELARRTYLEAIVASVYAGRLADERDIDEVSLAAKSAPLGPEPLAHSDLLVRGLAVRMSDGYVAAAPTLKEALHEYLAQPPALDWLCVSYNLVAMDLWDDEAWCQLAVGQSRLARATGTLSWLPFALDYLAEYHIQAGDLSQAAALLAERERIDPGIRAATLPYVPLLLAAWRGEAPTVTDLSQVMARGASASGEGAALAYVEYAKAVLYNGLADYGRAAQAAREATVADELVIAPWSLYELVEAAARTGQAEQATSAQRRLSGMARASGSDWALGISACSEALLSRGQAAESLYREALHRLSRTRVRTALARVHLLYGEWLRRENRRVDARDQLRRAHQMTTTMGIQGFAERARRELLATGETVRKRTVETFDELTPQEAQIARLAADRRSNAEIAAQLFISTRTVEWHLRKVFTKLGVGSRKDLSEALPDHWRMAPPR